MYESARTFHDRKEDQLSEDQERILRGISRPQLQEDVYLGMIRDTDSDPSSDYPEYHAHLL